ncbi:zinc-dependent alcohol dehydrogenase family protein [Aestuariivirga sp.]|uniref:zinc-dependent alcohol dehydrogenase family protein n=1 Tax=Aestuariivirga sp. TaxID=2650926 RepID=UPI0025BE7D8D|nr:zinc-dependent alcohol dehydrogenase family protein [Aestuariivirga sp.]MCA3555472.1 zinc-dependent alcohol dehydrogenase family protein [Aestuariivirga sp.]
MRAAIFDAYRGPLEIRSVPDPDCPPDGVILKIEACGVCRSDHHGWSGVDPDVRLPHVPGHEFAGVVLAVGPDVRAVKAGDRVTAPFILACGDCPDCRAGEATVCNHQHVVGFSGWGAFAERLAVPRADFNLVRLPDELGFAEAAAMGCRLTTTFRGLVDRADLKPGECLAIHGCGGVGLSAVMIGAALGAQIVAIDINEQALGMARSLGANVTLNPSRLADTALAVREVTGGGAHVSIDGLGITATIHNSVRSLRKLGRHVQIGQPLGRHASPPMPLLETVYARQISILGTRGIAAPRFSALLGMIAGGRLDPARIITKRIGLSITYTIFRTFQRRRHLSH